MRYTLSRAMVFLAAFFVLGVLPAEENGPVTRFSEHLIADKYGYAYGLAAADLNGDGHLDLTSQDIRGGGELSKSSLFWFENDGKGSFERHVIAQDEPGWFERHAIGDINGDGKPDVVVVNNRDGHLLWFANNDRPAAGPWKRHVITTKCPRAYDVALADLDGDGYLDVAAAGYASNLITWYKNPGKDGWDREWTRFVIDEKMSEVRTICAGDFNGDGKVDLLVTAVGAENTPLGADQGGRVVWYENPGKPTIQPWKKHVIDDKSPAPIHGHPVDMDGDGDLDVVMAFGMRDALSPKEKHQVVWYENVGKPGKGHEWKKHVIGDLPTAFEAVAADLNGDGRMDVVATSWTTAGRVVWFENSGDPRGKWTMHVLKENWGAANQVIVADFNGDKRPDIAATADRGSSSARVAGANELRWWRNEGRGK